MARPLGDAGRAGLSDAPQAPNRTTQFTVTEVFARRSVRDRLEWTGVVPSRLAAKFDRADMDLRVVLGALG